MVTTLGAGWFPNGVDHRVTCERGDVAVTVRGKRDSRLAFTRLPADPGHVAQRGPPPRQQVHRGGR